LEFSHLVNCADARVIERGGRARLAQEKRVRVLSQILANELQCDIALQHLIMGAVDHTHAALAELCANLIPPEGFSGHGTSLHRLAAMQVAALEDQLREPVWSGAGSDYLRAMPVRRVACVKKAPPCSEGWPEVQQGTMPKRKDAAASPVKFGF
jgi:hypothetical protein